MLCHSQQLIRAIGRVGVPANSYLNPENGSVKHAWLMKFASTAPVAAFAPQRFNSEGDLIDEETREVLRRHLREFGEWMAVLRAGRAFVRFGCEMDIQPSRT